MSMLGTGAAASIAQSSLQSSQIASQRDKKANDTAHQVERQRDVDEIHLFKVLEQRDTDETSARVNVDEQNDPHQQINAGCHFQGLSITHIHSKESRNRLASTDGSTHLV